MPNNWGHLAWRKRYATNIPSIDAHHQGFFKILRMLQDATHNGQMDAEVGPILEFLEKSSRVHFEGEETFMRRIGFPETEAHAREHARFTAHLRHLKTGLDRGDAGIPGDLVLMLHGWLKDHILQQDMVFAEYVRARP
jgi:hemerythrin-like metal-binding protein